MAAFKLLSQILHRNPLEPRMAVTRVIARSGTVNAQKARQRVLCASNATKHHNFAPRRAIANNFTGAALLTGASSNPLQPAASNWPKTSATLPKARCPFLQSKEFCACAGPPRPSGRAPIRSRRRVIPPRPSSTYARPTPHRRSPDGPNLVCGIGNIYRAELLYRARQNSFVPGKDVPEKAWNSLWRDAVMLMPDGMVDRRIVTTRAKDRPHPKGNAQRDEVHYVYRRQGEPCFVCGASVRRVDMAGRTL